MTLEQANAKLMIELTSGHAAPEMVSSLLQAAVDAILADEQLKVVCDRFAAHRSLLVRLYTKAFGYWSRRGCDPRAMVAISVVFGNAEPLTHMFLMLSDMLQKAEARGKGTPDEVMQAVIDFCLLASEPKDANAQTA